jgi:hypothetical protein
MIWVGVRVKRPILYIHGSKVCVGYSNVIFGHNDGRDLPFSFASESVPRLKAYRRPFRIISFTFSRGARCLAFLGHFWRNKTARN